MIGGKVRGVLWLILNAADFTVDKKVNRSIWTEICTQLQISKLNYLIFFPPSFRLQRASNKEAEANIIHLAMMRN